MGSEYPKRVFNPLLFWDAAEVDIIKHKKYIIERVLNFGDERDIKELRRLYSDDELISIIKNSRNIKKKTAIFWAIYFNIPQEEIRCLRKSLQVRL
ncbi:MAG: DUF6922 domain-containing protein [Thermodesulfovibrionales bacterium]